jgi:probable biosynthetic protein (TIGR04099 family)
LDHERIMNTLVRPIDAKEPSSSHGALTDVVVLGMPHLCHSGLSETWLLKDCGHRHWYLLARAAGLDRPDFRDAQGEPIYAAFLAVSLRDATLDLAREHDELVYSSRLTRVSRTQFTSIHRVSVRGRSIGTVAMTSTFVRRTQQGQNHTIARLEVPGLPPVASHPDAIAFAAESAALRSNVWDEHLGLARLQARAIDRFVVDPCPGQDFNGANFLYFASFQAFVDRAEWTYFRPQAPFPMTRRRDIIYRGNIDPGERVVLRLLQIRRSDQRLAHWYRLEREHDDRTIADVFTVRRATAANRDSKSDRSPS